MKSDKLIKILNGFLRGDDEDDWIERGEIANGCIPKEIREKITAKLGEWEFYVTSERSMSDTDVERTVLFFKDHDVYLAYDGYHDSWNGSNWDDAEFYEVKPVEKTYTDWEKV